MATIAAVAAAAYGAYSSHQQASAANRAAAAAGRPQSYSNDTNTQNYNDPYAPAAGYINDAFGLINQEFQNGAHQAAAAGPARGGGGGGGGSQNLGNVTVQNGVPGIMGRGGAFQPLGANAAAQWRASQGGGGSPGGGGAAPGGPPSDPAQLANWFAQQAAGDVAHPSQGITDAQGYAHDVLTGGTAAAPFARNSILNDLNQRLAGASFDRSQNLLQGFLGGQGGASGGGGYGGSGGGGGTTAANGTRVGSSASGMPMTADQRAAAVAHDQQMVSQLPGGGSGPSVGPGGGHSGSGTAIPDSMDDPNSWFNQQVQALFDPSTLDPMHDPTMQPYLDALRRQSQIGLEGQLNDIGDEANGLNMYGGSGFQVERGRARGDAEAGLTDANARAMYQARSDAYARRMAAMQGVSQRDLASMQDATQRYGIDSSASASGAASAASAALGNRSLDLQAILGMQGMDQFGLSTLGSLGNELNNTQQFAAGSLTPTLEGIRGAQLGQGFGMSNTLGQQNAAAQQRAQAQSRQAQQARALAPGQDLDDYLRRLTGLANPYAVNSNVSHSEGVGSGTPSGGGVSPTAAAVTGGLGAGLAAWGAFQQPQQQPQVPTHLNYVQPTYNYGPVNTSGL